MKRAITVTIDTDLLEKINNGDKLSHRVEELLQKGYNREQEENPKYVVDNVFNSLKELLRLRENKEIKISLIKKEEAYTKDR